MDAVSRVVSLSEQRHLSGCPYSEALAEEERMIDERVFKNQDPASDKLCL